MTTQGNSENTEKKRKVRRTEHQNDSTPKSCVDCPYGDHEAWCLIPGDWRERYYMPDDEISKYCPIWQVRGIKEYDYSGIDEKTD